MKTTVFLSISIRIIILFSVAMLATFLPEHLRGWFGDTIREKESFSGIDSMYDWGARHYWWFWMMFLLFILSCANVVLGIINIVNKNYDTSKW